MTGRSASTPDSWKAAVSLAAAIAFVLKILLAVNTYGTNDVYRWELFVLWGRYLGADIYRAAWDFNHPPYMIHATRLLDWLAGRSGISFPFWFRLPPILADVGNLVLLCRILAPRLREPSIRWGILFVALSPALILISGFHGNTDSVVIFFVLLSIFLTQKGASDWTAGAAFGMAMCVKVFPVIVIPAMLFYRRDYRQRFSFLAGMGIVIALASAPFFYQAPADTIRKVFGYHSIYGHWGPSYFIDSKQSISSLNSFFRAYGAWLLLALITAVSYRMNQSSKRPPLFSQVAVLFLLFLAGANGFGVQYLAWLVPFSAYAGAIPAAAFMVTSGAFLLLVYNYWSGGVPWYLADSNRVGDYQGHLDYFQILTWASVLLLLWAAWKQIRTGILWEDAVLSHAPRRAWAVALLLIGCVILPMQRRLHKDISASIPFGKDALLPIVAERYSGLSILLSQMGRPADALEVARQAP
jgi:hypothetical protein